MVRSENRKLKVEGVKEEKKGVHTRFFASFLITPIYCFSSSVRTLIYFISTMTTYG